MRKIILIMFLLFGFNQVYALSNPASVYCENNDGSSDFEHFSIGICKFADGSECEEWAYYTGDCKPGMYRNWVSEKESKKHILSYYPTEAGFIRYSKGLPLITKEEIVSKPEYVDEIDADYVYKKIIIQSINQFAQNDSSEKSQMVLLRNGENIGETDINKLSYYQIDYVYLYIPVENEGEYSVILKTNAVDESQGVETFSIPNTFTYKGIINEDDGEIQKESHIMNIIDWIKSFFKNIF